MTPVFCCTTVLLLATTHVMAAEQCLENFSSDGSILTGRTYKTWAVVNGVRPGDAFARIYAFTAENGFTVLSASKEAGVISAAQSASYGKGKTVPLAITLKEEADGLRVAISYVTAGGVFSPEEAIKRHFCMTVSASSNGPAGTVTTASPQPSAVQVRRSMPRGFADPTAEQQLAVKQELSKSLPTEKVRLLVAEATPFIPQFIERIACLADYSGASSLDEFAAPGIRLGDTYAMLRPMRTAQYHNKASCMTVSRIHGWSAPANNALKFEVIYKADDSGETAKLMHEAIKQPDGVWLFAR